MPEMSVIAVILNALQYFLLPLISMGFIVYIIIRVLNILNKGAEAKLASQQSFEAFTVDLKKELSIVNERVSSIEEMLKDVQ